MKKAPKVSICILNMNGVRCLEDCLSSAMNQEYADYEILLVDNGSSDGSVEFVRMRFPDVRVVELGPENVGVSVSRNVAVDNSVGEYIMTLDNDAVMDSRCLGELVGAIESNVNIGSCQAKIMRMDNQTTIEYIGFLRFRRGHVHLAGRGEKDEGQYDEPRQIVLASTCAALYRRIALEEAGKWDEDFFYMHEDVDLGLRLESLGWRCMYVPTATVFHYGSGTTGRKSNRTYYLFIRNRWYFVIKNFRILDIMFFLVETPWRVIWEIMPHLIKRRFDRFYMCLKGNIDGLRVLPELFAKRAQVRQSARTCHLMKRF